VTTPLVGVDEAARLLGAAAFLDVRWTLAEGPLPEEYAAGHVPGAHFVDVDRDLAGPPGDGGRHPLPDPPDFQAAMRRCGVSADRGVVAYDGGAGIPAARAWWLLRWAGHERVRVLDGGWKAWTLAGLEISTEAPPPAAGDFTARPGRMPVLDALAAADLARSGTLVDVRAPERYRGEQEPIDPVAGHIPGAKNIPATQIGPDVAERVAALGPGPYGSYCGSGIAASRLVLMLESAGVPAALYAGSWSEWIRDPQRPVATRVSG
jgi:thiosulfate/3-mercaptopyruvate sulfurtransferase